MSNETKGKVTLPKLIKVPVVIKDGRNENLTGEAKWVVVEARITPAFVTSYLPGVYTQDGETHTVTCVYVYGTAYYVNMTIEEFDKIMDKADRTYDLNFDEK